jgi:hypothetical protein
VPPAVLLDAVTFVRGRRLPRVRRAAYYRTYVRTTTMQRRLEVGHHLSCGARRRSPMRVA